MEAGVDVASIKQRRREAAGGNKNRKMRDEESGNFVLITKKAAFGVEARVETVFIQHEKQLGAKR